MYHSIHLETVTEVFHSLPLWKHLYNYFDSRKRIHELDMFNVRVIESKRSATDSGAGDRIIQ